MGQTEEQNNDKDQIFALLYYFQKLWCRKSSQHPRAAIKYLNNV